MVDLVQFVASQPGAAMRAASRNRSYRLVCVRTNMENHRSGVGVGDSARNSDLYVGYLVSEEVEPALLYIPGMDDCRDYGRGARDEQDCTN